MKRVSLTARMRLTLLLSVLFIGAGGILLLLNYTLVRYRLERMPVPIIRALPDALDRSSPTSTNSDQLIPITITSTVGLDTVRTLQTEVIATSLTELVVQSALALAIMSGVVVCLSWLIAGRVLRPVQEIIAVARRLSEERLHERIALQGPQDELKELADTFDGMLARLERAFASQRRFAASASHELRTPLTIMRTEIDVTLGDPNASPDELRAMGETVRTAVTRSERLIDGLLTLARSEQVLEQRDTVDLAALVEEALANTAALIEHQQVKYHVALAPALVSGDSSLLGRLVANLVENAVRHNYSHGWVRVGTHCTETTAVLIVENSSVVLSESTVNELFLPFRRGSGDRVGSRHGVGLGLTIARTIAEAHGGTVTAQALSNSELRVEVLLPSAAKALADAKTNGTVAPD